MLFYPILNNWTDLKPKERRPRAAGDKLEEGTLLLLAEVRHHGPERSDGRVGQLITPRVVGVGLQIYDRRYHTDIHRRTSQILTGSEVS